ncbi:MAG: hypothetical protein R2822_17585 [Spirosomataceae bacterium]
MIQQCFEQPKPRKPSQPTLQSIQKRRQAKERNAAIKAMRRKVDE